MVQVRNADGLVRVVVGKKGEEIDTMKGNT